MFFFFVNGSLEINQTHHR